MARRVMPFPDVGVPKDGAYFAFWQTVAIAAGLWGVSVIGVLGGIWYTLRTRL